MDIKDFEFHLDVKKDLYLDSLALTVLFTAIEQEFNTIFDDEDDEAFENARNLGQVVEILMKDPAIVWHTYGLTLITLITVIIKIYILLFVSDVQAVYSSHKETNKKILWRRPNDTVLDKVLL